MATDASLKLLKDGLTANLEFKEKDLITRSKWGSSTFEEAEADLDQIFDILSTLSLLPLEPLPETVVTGITGVLTPLLAMLGQIDAYDINLNNHTQTRDGLVNEAHKLKDALVIAAAQWIPYLAYQKGDVSQNIEKLSKSVDDAKSLYEQAETDINIKKDLIDSIVEAARQASASAGAAVFTKDFLDESDNLKKDVAKPWLRATVALAALTVIVAAIMWFWTADSGLDSGQIIQKIGTKIFVLATLLTSTLWCGSMYKSAMHQSVVYRHRGLSIKTLEAFHHSAADPSAKDAVVLEAARAIYGSTPTGLVSDSNSGSDPATRIIEVTKTILPGDE